MARIDNKALDFNPDYAGLYEYVTDQFDGLDEEEGEYEFSGDYGKVIPDEIEFSDLQAGLEDDLESVFDELDIDWMNA